MKLQQLQEAGYVSKGKWADKVNGWLAHHGKLTGQRLFAAYDQWSLEPDEMEQAKQQLLKTYGTPDDNSKIVNASPGDDILIWTVGPFWIKLIYFNDFDGTRNAIRLNSY